MYYCLLKKGINITKGLIRKNIHIKTTVENKSILSETTQVTYNGYHITFEIPEKLNMLSKKLLTYGYILNAVYLKPIHKLYFS